MNLPAIGQSFEVFDSLPSTNLYAMDRVRQGLAAHGDAFLALHQTEGKGQWGKKWWTAPGQNIQLTVVLQPHPLAISQHFRLSAALALGVLDWLTTQVPDGFKIKWPNDLFYRDRKAGGILIENLFHANSWQWAVAGFGINLNATQFDESIPNPISLSQITGRQYDIEQMAKSLCSFLEQRWRQLLDGKWAELLLDYNQHLYANGHSVRLKTENHTALYPIRGVSENGQLLAGEHGEFVFDHGSVQWV